MTRSRLLIDALLEEGRRVALDREQAHYVAKVLRLEPGSALELTDGAGERYLAELFREEGGHLGVKAGESLGPAVRPFPVCLAQGLPKGSKMDLVARMATEVGIDTLVPFTSARSVPRLSDGRGEERAARWQRVAEAAARQCGRASAPRVEQPTALDELPAVLPDRPLVVLWEEEALPLRRVLAGLGRAEGLSILVGPEGGLTGEEVRRMAGWKGTLVAGLGELVLRTETAGPIAAALVQYELGVLGGDPAK